MEFFSDILVQYSIFMLAEYSDKAGGFLPVSIINDMKHQIIESAQKLFDIYKSEDLIEIFFSALDKQLFRKNCIDEANNIIYKYYGK